MNNEMRLARMDLGEGWIDLGYGEPIVVQEVFKKHMNPMMLPNKETFLDSQYQPPQGNKQLVALLESKYQARVVITNGAKQGIAATMYALKKLGHKSCAIHSPYWVSTPTLISDAGLKVVDIAKMENDASNAFMLTSPNNPDGKELTKAQVDDLIIDARAEGIALIHDAAYYTPIYMQNPADQQKIGDVQIYSFSKMYGLSGLRLGYVVVHNEALLPGVIEFVERACSGVSTASQAIALSVESFFTLHDPGARQAFEQEAREAIATSRKELALLKPEILIPEACASNSMFAWCKAGPALDAAKVKVNILHGDIFGRPGMVRLNIAMRSDLIRTAIERLNGGVHETSINPSDDPAAN